MPTYLCQWVFAAPPKSLVLREVIDVVLERANKPIPHGLTGQDVVFYTTGPSAFTEGIRRYLKKRSIETPEYVNGLANERVRKAGVYVIPELAFHGAVVTHIGTGESSWKKQAKLRFT